MCGDCDMCYDKTYLLNKQETLETSTNSLEKTLDDNTNNTDVLRLIKPG